MYSFSIRLVAVILRIVGLFNHKIKLGVEGRDRTFETLKTILSDGDKTMWFHCASLGEYEQGLPVFKALKSAYPRHKILLTFFSPSGYEVRKTSEIADVVTYLPLDTRANAKRFVNLVQPELSLFVKYDIWPNYLLELNKQGLKASLISANFRPQQIYFKWYGSKLNRALKSFESIFVQNPESKRLLDAHGFKNVVVAGDTRFDRVYNQLSQNNQVEVVEQFKKDELCIVIGSSWPADEELLIPYINDSSHSKIKFVIAPHEIKRSNIDSLKKQLKPPVILYSEVKEAQTNIFDSLGKAKVRSIDKVGLLSKIYSYADIAYVGGAMGQTGLHNILEPAVFGIPIVIGKNYSKFPEAFEMIENAGVTSIHDHPSLESHLNNLIDNHSLRLNQGKKNLKFIKKKKGAVIQIMESIRI